jgi:hypothetical protein
MDPLRCELDVLEPESFQALVSRLLEAHEFRVSREIDIASLLDADIGSVSAMVGRLYLTYEWLAPIETEFGVGPESDFRIEAPPDWAHGDVLVIVHSRFLAAPQQTEATRELVSALRDDGADHDVRSASSLPAAAGQRGVTSPERSWRAGSSVTSC